MGRKKKIKPEEVVEAPVAETPVLNAAVFTEYPSVTEQVVEAKVVEKEEPKVEPTPKTDLQQLEAEMAEAVKKEDYGKAATIRDKIKQLKGELSIK